MERLLCISCLLILWTALVSAQGVKIDPENEKFVTLGEESSVKCVKEDSTDIQDIKWQRNGVDVAASDSQDITVYQVKVGSKSYLKFKKFSAGEAGIYKCIGIRPGADPVEATIQIRAKVELKITSKEKQLMFIHQPGSINCETTAQAEITWARLNDQGIYEPLGSSDRIQLVGTEMKFSNVTMADEGSYKCSAFPFDDISTEGSPSLRITVEVYIPPKITKYPENGESGTRGDLQKELICQACGKPTPEFYFTKAGSIAFLGEQCLPGALDCDNSGHYQKTTRNVPGQPMCREGVLAVNNLQSADTADYTCRALSSYGKDDDGNDQVRDDAKTFKFEVIDPPTIREFVNKTANVGDSTDLICRVDGTLKDMTLEFQKVGSRAPFTKGCQASDARICVTDLPADPIDAQNTAIKLTITGLKKTDKANYTCIAVNKGGSMLRNGSITVNYKPEVDASKSDKKVFNWLGNKANMTCVFDAEPPLTEMKWIKNGVVVGRMTADSIYTKYFNEPALNGSLEVFGKGDKDDQVYGTYTCNATNSMGTSSHTIEMVQAVEPSPPVVSENVDKKSPRTISLSVALGEDAGKNMEVLEYIVKYGEDREQKFPFAQGTSQELIIENLQPATAYTLQVLSRNAAFRGKPFTLSTKTAEIEKPSVVKIVSPTKSTYSKSYTLRWNLPSDGGDKVTAFHIELTEVGSTKKTKKVSAKGNDEQVDLKNLLPDTEYEVTIVAENGMGKSAKQTTPFKFRTMAEPYVSTSVPGDGGDTKPSTAKGGLSTGVIIVIVIILFVIILIIIDVTCYFRNQCGLLMCICVSCCGKKPPATETTEKEQLKMEEGQGEGESGQPAEQQVLTVSENPEADAEKKEALPEDEEAQPLKPEQDEKKDPEKDEDSKALVDEKAEDAKDDDDLKKVEVEVKDGGGEGKTTSPPTAL